MKKTKPRKRNAPAPAVPAKRKPVGLRIIGGHYGGRKLAYGGDSRVRPMKDRLREAIFNLLGPRVQGKHAIDLFAGTGALGLEALSRGAARATLIERHFPTAKVIGQNVATLEAEHLVHLVTSSVFIWQKRPGDLGSAAWVVFCSPPYDFFVDRTEAMLELIGNLIEQAPAESLFVVESDNRFDHALLPTPEAWTVHAYPPAVVGIFQKIKTPPEKTG